MVEQLAKRLDARADQVLPTPLDATVPTPRLLCVSPLAVTPRLALVGTIIEHLTRAHGPCTGFRLLNVLGVHMELPRPSTYFREHRVLTFDETPCITLPLRLGHHSATAFNPRPTSTINNILATPCAECYYILCTTLFPSQYLLIHRKVSSPTDIPFAYILPLSLE